MSSTPDLDRFGDAVRTRREELGLTQMDVWQRGGPSNTTLTKIENAEGGFPSAGTLRKLDLALRWRDGSARRVLEGGEPEELSAARREVDPPRARGGVVDTSASELTLEELWERWVDLYLPAFQLEIEYAKRRGYRFPEHARRELLGAFVDLRYPDHWIPPWEREPIKGALRSTAEPRTRRQEPGAFTDLVSKHAAPTSHAADGAEGEDDPNDLDLAALTMPPAGSLYQQGKRLADSLGEESQDPGGDEPA